MSEKTLWNWQDEYEFLRNDFSAEVQFNGITFPTVEHAFQAAKSQDLNAKLKFTEEFLTPREAKEMGRTLDLRPDWDEVRDVIMMILVRVKFFDNEDLGTKLLETGTANLVMGFSTPSKYDAYWGALITECDSNPIVDGDNRLGRILMDVRQELALYRGVDLKELDKPKLSPEHQKIADVLNSYLPSKIDSVALAGLLLRYHERDAFNEPFVEEYDKLYDVLMSWDS